MGKINYPVMRDHQFVLRSEELTAENLQTFDCIVLATDHDAFDYDLIAEHGSLIVDTRSVYPKEHEHIVKA